MNKYRKAESRRVKAHLRYMHALGYDHSYKRARRHIRKVDRVIRNLPKNVHRCLHKGIKRVDYHVSEAVRAFAKLKEVC